MTQFKHFFPHPLPFLFWLEVQEEAGEPQTTTAQERDVKEEGEEPSRAEAQETGESAAQEEKGKEEKGKEEKGKEEAGKEEGGKEEEDEEEPKPKPRPVRTKVRSCVPEIGVDLAIGESGIEAEEPITVGQLFKNTLEKFPTHPALNYKEDGAWKTITYTGYYELCIKAAKSFLKVRVEAV